MTLHSWSSLQHSGKTFGGADCARCAIRRQREHILQADFRGLRRVIASLGPSSSNPVVGAVPRPHAHYSRPVRPPELLPALSHSQRSSRAARTPLLAATRATCSSSANLASPDSHPTR